MKIFGFYNEGVDKTWYRSSNIVFSECLDPFDSYKTLTVVFSNGATYKYKNVEVQDYLMFRDAESQGKALGKYIKAKGYEYERLEDSDLEAIQKELEERTDGWLRYEVKDGILLITDEKENVLFSSSDDDKGLIENGAVDLLERIVQAIGFKLRKK